MNMNKETVVLTTDVVITDEQDRVLLIRRGHEPFREVWSLPGGKVDAGETVEQAAVREVKEEVGVDVELTSLVGVYSEPGRDPRGSYISIVWRGSILRGSPTATEEAREFRWLARGEECAMGFDHGVIVLDHWKGGGRSHLGPGHS